MTDKFILAGKTVVPCHDLLTWGKWVQTADRNVARDFIGATRISTVFLGLDHNYEDDGEPLIFETMVFGGPLDGEMVRYSTWEAAEKGHAAMVARVGETGTDSGQPNGQSEAVRDGS